MRPTFLRSLLLVFFLTVPLPARAGVDRWTSLGPNGGEILSLAVDPDSPGRLYAGTLTGDVWKSLDKGGHWAPTPEGLGAYWINALAVSRGRVFAATSSGIFVLTDGAAAWRDTGPSPREEVRRLAVDPKNSDRLWAGTVSGRVLTSEDGGARWTVKLDLGQSIDSIAVAPSSPPAIYAAGRSGVFKSVSAGSTWSQIVPGDRSGGRPHGGAALNVDPEDAKTLYLLAADKVWKTIDAGKTWKAVSPAFADPVTLLVLPGSLLAGTNQGLMRSADSGATWQRQLLPGIYATVLAADPSAPGGAWAGAGDRGVFHSADSGRTWVARRRGLTASYVERLAIDPFQPRTLYMVTARLFRSLDAGVSWQSQPLQNVASLAADPRHPDTLYAATDFDDVERGGLWISQDRGSHWRSLLKSPDKEGLFLVALDPAHPGTIFAGDSVDLRRSRDGGRTWKVLPRLFGDGSGTSALLFSPWHPGTLYRFEGSYLGRSTDGGDTWELIPPGEQGIAALAFDSKTPDLLYAADSNFGGIWKSRDGGSTWEPVTPLVGDSGVLVTSLLVDPLDPAILYLGTHGSGLWRSQDRGVTWEPFSLDIHAPYITCLKTDPRDPRHLFACTLGAGLIEIRRGS